MNLQGSHFGLGESLEKFADHLMIGRQSGHYKRCRLGIGHHLGAGRDRRLEETKPLWVPNREAVFRVRVVRDVLAKLRAT